MKNILLSTIVLIGLCACEKKFKVSENQVPLSHENVEVESITTDTLTDSVRVNGPAVQQQSNEISEQAKLLKKTNDGLNK